MKLNTAGILLTHYREKYKLSQTQISEGICSITTLCRIEQGYREVDSLVSQSLVERLGKQVLEFELLLNEEDYNRMTLRDSIKQELRKENYENAEFLLERYQKIMPEKEILHRQFYLCGKAQVFLSRDEDKTQAIGLLKEAMYLTKPEYDNDIEKEQLYSEMELEIAFLLAIFEKNKQKAEYQMQKMIDFIEKYESVAGQQYLELLILKELIKIKKKQKEEESLIAYLNKAIYAVTQNYKIGELAELHFEKAKSMKRLFGTVEKWDECTERPEHLKECIRECLMAYHVADVMGYSEIKKDIEKFIGEKLGWQITG